MLKTVPSLMVAATMRENVGYHDLTVKILHIGGLVQDKRIWWIEKNVTNV